MARSIYSAHLVPIKRVLQYKYIYVSMLAPSLFDNIILLKLYPFLTAVYTCLSKCNKSSIVMPRIILLSVTVNKLLLIVYGN